MEKIYNPLIFIQYEQKNYNQEKSVKCGKTTDSIETLTKLCNEEAAKLAATIKNSTQSIEEVAFWTEDIPELICIGKFSKDANGSVVYQLDFSSSTL